MKVTQLPELGVDIKMFALANWRNKKIVLTGGEQSNQASDKAYELDLLTGTWRMDLPALNVPRKKHGSCRIGDKVYVLFGQCGDKVYDRESSIEYLEVCRPAEVQAWHTIELTNLIEIQQFSLCSGYSWNKIVILGGHKTREQAFNTESFVLTATNDGTGFTIERRDTPDSYQCSSHSPAVFSPSRNGVLTYGWDKSMMTRLCECSIQPSGDTWVEFRNFGKYI